MPHHRRTLTCRKTGAALSSTCSCAHCTFTVCDVCGGAAALQGTVLQGTLTTDCPGSRIDVERLTEIAETNLDYTDDRGWHLAQERRAPRFDGEESSPSPPRVDPRAIVAPTIDWAAIDRMQALQSTLAEKAVAWVLADRRCEDRSAALAAVQDGVGHLHGKKNLDASERDLLGTLEQEKISFQIACRDVERCDEEFKQVARRLVEVVETLAPSKR